MPHAAAAVILSDEELAAGWTDPDRSVLKVRLRHTFACCDRRRELFSPAPVLDELSDTKTSEALAAAAERAAHLGIARGRYGFATTRSFARLAGTAPVKAALNVGELRRRHADRRSRGSRCAARRGAPRQRRVQPIGLRTQAAAGARRAASEGPRRRANAAQRPAACSPAGRRPRTSREHRRGARVHEHVAGEVSGRRVQHAEGRGEPLPRPVRAKNVIGGA